MIRSSGSAPPGGTEVAPAGSDVGVEGPIPHPTSGNEATLLATAGLLAAIHPPAAPIVAGLSLLVGQTLAARLRAWVESVEQRLTERFGEEAEGRIRELATTPEFASLFLQAAQAATRNHHGSKHHQLRNVLLNSADCGPDEFDVSASFVRYVDELGTLHIALLQWVEGHPEILAEWEGMSSYKLFRRRYLETAIVEATPEEFEMAVEELRARGLLHVSERVSTYARVMKFQKPVLEHPGGGNGVAFNPGPMVEVSRLGKALLRFIADPDT